MSEKKLFSDLDEWVHIGIGDDILNTSARPEFQRYVKQARKLKVQDEMIPAFVLGLLFEKARKKSFAEKLKGLFA